MADKMYTDAKMYSIISTAFGDLKSLARKELEKKWKKMASSERCAAGRALVCINDVEKNPAKHFSRDCTEAMWNARALEYAQKYSMKETWMALYFVSTPAMVAYYGMENAFTKPETRLSCLRLCEAIKDWEYHRTAKRCAYEQDVDKILNLSQQISSARKFNETSPIKRKVLDFVKLLHR